MMQWLGWLPSIAYPVVDPKEGWWYPQTSTINWCEEDYYATPIIAEFVNTLTNLLFMYLGAKGIRNCIEQGWDRVYLVSFLGYLCVGTGSFLFHATLKYPMQLVDELSMIYTTCIMVYAVFSFTQSVLFRQILALGLVSLCAFITAYYHYLQDPTFHQNAYALLTAVVIFRSMYIMEVSIRPSLQKGYVKLDGSGSSTGVIIPNVGEAVYENGNRNGNAKEDSTGLHQDAIIDSAHSKSNGNGIALQHTTFNYSVHAKSNGNGYTLKKASSPVTAESQATDLAILNRMWLIVASGLITFLGGFLLWTLDNNYCSLARTWRHRIGMPWGILLEGHGWWHLMTGTGAYMSLVWGIWLRECLKGNKRGVVCRWLGDGPGEEEEGRGGRWRWLPEVIRVENDEETGEVREMRRNGHRKLQ